MYCSLCGTQNSDTAQFCQKCGAKFEKNISSDSQSKKHGKEKNSKKYVKGGIIRPIILSSMFLLFLTIAFRSVASIRVDSLDTGFRWEETKGGVIITSYEGDSSIVEIPGELDGKMVIGIGEQFFYKNENVEKVIIPSTVTMIGKEAFAKCKKLVELEIPSSVVDIGESAFFQCESLGSIHVPATVKTIGDSAFSECKVLEYVTIEEGVEVIESYAFSGCDSLTNITIPSTVTLIGSSCFDSSINLKEVYIKQGIYNAEIGHSAFAGTSIEEITIPGNYIKIGGSCFKYCNMLNKVVWKKSSSGEQQVMNGYLFENSVKEFHGSDSIVEIKDKLANFPNSEFCIFAPSGSYLENYAEEKGYAFEVEE